MSERKIISDSIVAFNHQCDVVFPNVEADRAKQLLQKIKNEVSRIELSISRTLDVSEILQLNNSAKNEWLTVSDELWEILRVSFDFYTMSNGALDVTCAPLFDAWKEADALSEEKISEAKSKSGFDKVEIDSENKRFRFLTDGMQFDFGALQKAYVLDILGSLLKEENISDAIVSFEEESVLALGVHPNGKAWPMGIRNLEHPNEFVHVFSFSDQVVVTTGTEYIDMETGMVKSRNIISPETGEKLQKKMTVSVRANSALMAAFVSYIWLILPENDKSIIADQLKDVEIFECEYLDDDIRTKLTLIGEEGNDD